MEQAASLVLSQKELVSEPHAQSIGGQDGSHKEGYWTEKIYIYISKKNKIELMCQRQQKDLFARIVPWHQEWETPEVANVYWISTMISHCS